MLHIQGSGRVTLPGGRQIHVGFAGHNGRAFRGIGSILRDAGVLKGGQTTMDKVRAWLRSHPAEAAAYMDENARYIFFRLRADNAAGPVGSLGAALTPGRSLAVDPRFIPLGAPLWLETSDPDGQPIRRLVVAQDTGAAITGAVRGDLFWGHGESAFAMAARMSSPGRYFILVPQI
jgi:membrane-bound lytic murein transglycosylase A